MSIIYPNGGELLRAIRDKAGVNQDQAGEVLGVSRNIIGKWEGDFSDVPFRKLTRLARQYDVDFIHLIKSLTLV